MTRYCTLDRIDEVSSFIYINPPKQQEVDNALRLHATGEILSPISHKIEELSFTRPDV
jgi:hypothetical protein